MSQERKTLGCQYLNAKTTFTDGLAERLGAFCLPSAFRSEVLLLQRTLENIDEGI